MNDEDQIDFLDGQEIVQNIPVFYIPTDGPPHIEERVVVGSHFDATTGTSFPVPKTKKHETVSYKDDGSIIIHGP